MKFQRKKKNLLTLLEVMIVIFLIGLIGSVIGYNMKGGLDKGKMFKTEQAAAKIRDILLLAVSDGASIDDVIATPRVYLDDSGLCKDSQKLLKDGWGHAFDFQKNVDGDDIEVISQTYLQQKAKEDLKRANIAAQS